MLKYLNRKIAKQKGVARIFLLTSILVGIITASSLQISSFIQNIKDALISRLQITQSTTTTTGKMDAKTAESLGWHLLSADEYAIIKTSSGKPTGQTSRQSFVLDNGKTINFDSNSATSFSILQGSDKNTQYIKSSPGVEIHSKNELSGSQTDKVAPELYGKLSSADAKTPVIIKFNLPFNRFYEKNQSAASLGAKTNAFVNAKNKSLSLFSSKSNLKKDLKIINGIAADIDQVTLIKLLASPDIKKIEIDTPVQALLDTSVDQIHAKDVWGMIDNNGNTLTGKGERIAIIDTGADYTHPDLGGCLGTNCKVIGGYDFINNDNDPMDDNGHGTHVAATAAGKGLLNGVAPDASIIAYKVLNADGRGYSSSIISAIEYTTDPNQDGNTNDHVDVASMSLGGAGNPDDAMSTAIDNATAAGVVFTVAAGNSGLNGPSTINSPGTARTAITVAASCKTAQIGDPNVSYCANPIASFSSKGPLIWNGADIQKPDLAAPGVLICAARWGTSFSTAPTCFDSHHVRISGTSMATPHMAGVAALFRQAYPDYTPDQVKQLLKNSTRNLGMGYNDQGTGEISVPTAIPQIQKAKVTPTTWSVTTSPVNKYSRHTQSFSVTPNDSTINTLDVSFSNNISGITGSSSKQTLQVSNKTTDSFQASLSIDNDTVKSGNYMVWIYFKENGATKGAIPILLTVSPTISANPTDIDYGIDTPSLASWTSDNKTVTVTNLRTDVSQNIAVSSSSYPAGITLNAPASITVPAGGNTNIDTKLSVNNSGLANNIYKGSIILSNPANYLPVSTKFTKFYILYIAVNDGSPNSESCAKEVVVHDRAGTVYKDCSDGATRTIYLNGPGTYDVIAIYNNDYNGSNYEVFKEGITVTGGITNVAVSRTEANHLVKTIPTDVTGKVLTDNDNNLAVSYERLTYLPNPQNFNSRSYLNSPGYFQNKTERYFSNVSNNYKYERLIASNQPATAVYFYEGSFTGLQSDTTFTNTPASFTATDINWDLDQQSGNTSPSIWLGFSPGAYTYGNSGNLTISLPAKQTVYSMVPDPPDPSSIDPWGKFLAIDNEIMSPIFTTGVHPKRLFPFFGDDRILLSDFQERKIYAGLGPSVWLGKFHNSASRIIFGNYFGISTGTFGIPFALPMPIFMRQDYAAKIYTDTPFSIYKDSSLFYSGQILAYNYFGNYSYFNPVPINNPGKYEFKTDFPYKNKGLDMVGKVDATFDTSLSDPNPPSFKRLYFLSGSLRTEQFDPTVVNNIEFELDPVGGSLSQVKASYSKDGTTFHPMTVRQNGSVYSANITPVSGISKVAVRISATDNSSSSLTYTFEMPVGAGSALLDTQAPTAAITSPVNGASIQGTLNVTANAQDNFGVDKTELYLDGAFAATSSAEPFSFSVDTSQFSAGSHSLVVKAYDEAGNVGSSPAVNISIPQPPSPITISNVVASPNPFTSSSQISYNLSGACGVPAAVIIALSGTTVRSWNFNSQNAGNYIFTWDGKDNGGTVLSEGPYIVAVVCFNSAGQVTAEGWNFININPYISNATVSPQPFIPSSGNALFSFNLSGLGNNSYSKVMLYSMATGAEVKEFTPQQSSSTPRSESWDGHDSSGNVVPNGQYLFMAVGIPAANTSQVHYAFLLFNIGPASSTAPSNQKLSNGSNIQSYISKATNSIAPKASPSNPPVFTPTPIPTPTSAPIASPSKSPISTSTPTPAPISTPTPTPTTAPKASPSNPPVFTPTPIPTPTPAPVSPSALLSTANDIYNMLLFAHSAAVANNPPSIGNCTTSPSNLDGYYWAISWGGSGIYAQCSSGSLTPYPDQFHLIPAGINETGPGWIRFNAGTGYSFLGTYSIVLQASDGQKKTITVNADGTIVGPY